MPTVVIENISSIGLLRSDTEIVVLLDNKTKHSFNRDQKVEFLVEAGEHTLQVRVGGVHSLTTTFRAEKGDVIGFECSRAGMWQGHVVLTPLFHNRPHARFNIERNEIARENRDGQSSPKREPPHWSDILNVAPHAAMEEIEVAYQKLMKAYAPERFSEVPYEDSEAMERKGRLINEAYEAARNEKQP
jgi:hypothetical protein